LAFFLVIISNRYSILLLYFSMFSLEMKAQNFGLFSWFSISSHICTNCVLRFILSSSGIPLKLSEFTNLAFMSSALVSGILPRFNRVKSSSLFWFSSLILYQITCTLHSGILPFFVLSSVIKGNNILLTSSITSSGIPLFVSLNHSFIHSNASLI